MNSIDRVSEKDYSPSTDDILRVRFQTMGIASHEFTVQVSGKSILWHLFDVGGARGQRHTWVPYFDDANAIIFLAPVSAFDQVCALSYLSIIKEATRSVFIVLLYIFAPYFPSIGKNTS